LVVDAFEALADPVRRAILRQLATGPARVVDLASGHPISRPAISRHLRVLTEAGLAAGRDAGRERWYRLVSEPLGDVRELLAALTGPDAGRPPVPESALDALETEVHRTVRDRRRPAAGSTTPAEVHQESA
jgi:DNA-binding transcriptional ArsR family regulator